MSDAKEPVLRVEHAVSLVDLGKTIAGYERHMEFFRTAQSGHAARLHLLWAKRDLQRAARYIGKILEFDSLEGGLTRARA